MSWCFPKPASSSAGLWMEDSPLQATLPLTMIQVTLVIVVSRLLHRVLRPLGQSIIVAQMLTGVLLGPVGLGRIHLFRVLFSPNKMVVFKMLGLIGLILFKFLIGVKIDVGLLRQSGKKAVSIGLSGQLPPMVLTVFVWNLVWYRLPHETDIQRTDLIISEAIEWSVSSLIVVASLLDELKLLNTKLGRLAVAASLIETAIEVVCNIGVKLFYVSQGTLLTRTTIVIFTSFTAFIVFVIYVARPMTQWIVRRTMQGGQLAEPHFVLVLVFALVCGFTSEFIGQRIGTGVLLLGLALPSGPPVGSTLVERLEGVIMGLFFPIFFVIVGLNTDFANLLTYLVELRHLQIFHVICALGKIVGIFVAARYCGMSFYDALTLNVIMNTRGVNEIVRLHAWQDQRLNTNHIYTVVLFEILVMAAWTAPLVRFLYNPSKRYGGNRRRMIQHGKHNVELRLLACIHSQENAASAIQLIDSLCAGAEYPLCVYLLHAMELVGRVATVLLPYQKGKNSSYASAATDQVVAAFHNFKDRKGSSSSFTLQPFFTISPYATMFDDICSLALDKKVLFILLPFHKMEADGTVDASSEAMRSVNLGVLNYAPCSVGMLIDHSLLRGAADVTLSTESLQNVAVYFFGGGDDREALALAMRMAVNPRVGITVVLFVAKDASQRAPDVAEEKMDSEMLYEFKVESGSRGNMVFREEMVEDSEEIISVIRTTSNASDLLIVGRREGVDSELTEGLSVWSEHQELGVIGDMLASADFVRQGLTLVVQQQRVGGRPNLVR